MTLPESVRFMFWMFVWTAMLEDTKAFIFSTRTCFDLPPCGCSLNKLQCEGKNLTSFPIFNVQNVTDTYIYYFHLEDNQLTTIPARPFRNLTFKHYTDIYMYIDNNRIESIAPNAFEGIQDILIFMNLNNNRLITIPQELQKLSKLNTLYIQNNPLKSLNAITMQRLGRSRTSLFIDLNHFSIWPSNLNSLTSLGFLFVRYLNVTHLNVNAFDGFAHSLQTLHIQYSQLERVPEAVCNLHSLQILEFSFNDNIRTNQTLFETCPNALAGVTDVRLNNNNLRYMPDIFRNFPSVTTLYVNNNNISFIQWDTMPANASIRMFNSENNAFTSIPSVVNKLHALIHLSLSYNKIQSVVDGDLNNLRILRSLSLDNNPIDFISPHAFDNNAALNRLDLVNTRIHQLPSSLARLHQLSHIFIMRTPIECDCDMSVLKPLSATRLSIYGNCWNSTRKIEDYLKNDVPNCP